MKSAAGVAVLLAIPVLAQGVSVTVAAGTPVADGRGVAQDPHSIPSTVVGTVFSQMLPFDVQGGQLVLRATDGLQLDGTR